MLPTGSAASKRGAVPAAPSNTAPAMNSRRVSACVCEIFSSRLIVTSRLASGYLGTGTAGFPRLSKNCWFSRTEHICWYRKKPVRESVKLRRAFHGFV